MQQSNDFKLVERHLNSSALNYVDVSDPQNKTYLLKKAYLKTINDKYGSLENMLAEYLSQNITRVQIFLRVKNGTSSTLNPYVADLKLANADAEKEKASRITPQQESYPQNTPMLNGHQQNGDYMQSQYLKDRISDLREKIADLKIVISEEKEDKKKYKRKLQEAQEEITKYKVELATFEKQKELALKEKDLEQKSILDSDAAKSLAEGLSGVLGNYMGASKEMPALQQPALNGAENLSPIKKAIIEVVTMPTFTEEHCAIVQKTIDSMLTNPDFSKSLIALLQQQTIINQETNVAANID